ncbi:MAG: DedA family protein [Planctomycetia bacterium]|nr:DedA family protein [Planctomycetia bacterium]
MLLADFGFNELLNLFLHLDKHLNEWAATLGPWLYVVVFAIIFCETGLVVTPFLPGDSLLFALGALAASPGSPLDIWLLITLMIVAAILGDAVNYSVGYFLGPKVFRWEKSWLLNKKHLLYAQDFYERWGSWTIVMCRFVPIVRTFGPFVAGIGKMKYAKFGLFNVFGAFLWVLSMTLAGYWFGNLPFVKDNFSYVILAIVLISVLPMFYAVWSEWRRSKQLAQTTQQANPAS